MDGKGDGMIEPPITDIIDLLDSCGFVAKGAYLRDAAKELEALRAIVKELAATDEEIYADDGFCIFCGETGKHEEDCLISRAKERVKS